MRAEAADLLDGGGGSTREQIRQLPNQVLGRGFRLQADREVAPVGFDHVGVFDSPTADGWSICVHFEALRR